MEFLHVSLRFFLVVAALVCGCADDDPKQEAQRTATTDPQPVVKTPDTDSKPVETEPWFVDEAKKRGIDLLNQTGKPGVKELIMGAVGPGAAVLDANGDGRLDLYIPNGNWLEGPRREQFYMKEDRPRNALYIQQADGTFRNEAKARGVDDDAWSFGSCAADLDGDGDQDLVVTNLGPNRLYLNDGSGKFTDVAAQAGIAGHTERAGWEWSTGIAIADYDKDGVLDIYVSNYADLFKWMHNNPRIKRDEHGNIPEGGARICEWQGLLVYCGPVNLPAQQDHLFRGTIKDGRLAYENVSKSAGIFIDKPENGPYYGFQVLFTDLNRDGWLDIYVANDSVPSYFFESNRDGTFRECAHEYNIAVGRNGEDMAGMGSDTADITGDGWLDVHKTNFGYQTNNIYVAEPQADGGGVQFRDFSIRAGVKKDVYRDLGWSLLVFDYDHDGLRDLYYANGHVYPEVDFPEAKAIKSQFDQYNRIFRNESRDGRLRLRAMKDMGPGLEIKKSSRGASLVDFDNDGDLDILVVNLNSTPDLLVNRLGNKRGHWVMLTLRGNTQKKVAWEAIGSRLELKVNGKTQHREVKRGQGFLGCHDPRVHFGLGDHAGPVELKVKWPNGEESSHKIDQVDRVVEIKQP